MSGEWVKEATTLGLVEMLIEGRQQFVEISGANWLRPRKRFRKAHKLRHLSQRRQAIGDQLSVRYQGILLQMTGRVRTLDSWDEAELENCQRSIWQAASDRTQNMTNYRKFCGMLWDICTDELSYFGNVAPLTALRPKFMLRQFIDEMPNSDARGLLRASAFGEDKHDLSGRELCDSLNLAFPLLHLQVLSRIDDLSALTDGEITPQIARAIKEPYLEYRRWLFES